MKKTNKVFKLDKRGFSKRVRKMRKITLLIMALAFTGTMVVLNALETGLTALTMLMVSLLLGLVYYFLDNWMNGRMVKVLNDFAIEITDDAVLLRQNNVEEKKIKREEIEGVGKNASGGYAILLKGEEGSFPIPEELENKAGLVNEIQRFLEGSPKGSS